MVPAYTMPKNIEDWVVMRIVVRQGFSRDMADMLLGDIRDAISELEKLEYPTPSRISLERKEKVKGKIFTHTGGKRH
jgi:glutamate decarboxylase